MESFFQRMSSIVGRNNKKFSEEDMDEEESERHRQFNNLKGRRQSAPDVRRRTVFRVPDVKGTSDEQIATHLNTTTVPRKLSNATGKLFLSDFAS